MVYAKRITMCSSESELFDIWKKKDIIETSYVSKGKSIPTKINHADIFVSDGVVNQDVWYGNNEKKRIAFILKEAYGGKEDWSLTEELRQRAPWSSIWKRVVEWTYGIQNTTGENVVRYEPDKISMDEHNEWLNQIAVVNLKKSSGGSASVYEEIMCYAMNDAVEIKKQLAIIQPEIVICGSTFKMLNEIYGNKIRTDENYCDNWFYYTELITGKKCLVIDYYHPANYYPPLLNYYAVVNIYQQALKTKTPENALHSQRL